ncbi:9405_t:CDS:2, partial [Racocetra fulgida]
MLSAIGSKRREKQTSQKVNEDVNDMKNKTGEELNEKIKENDEASDTKAYEEKKEEVQTQKKRSVLEDPDKYQKLKNGEIQGEEIVEKEIKIKESISRQGAEKKVNFFRNEVEIALKSGKKERIEKLKMQIIEFINADNVFYESKKTRLHQQEILSNFWIETELFVPLFILIPQRIYSAIVNIILILIFVASFKGSDFAISFVLIVSLILAFLSFFVYQIQKKINQQQNNFRQQENQVAKKYLENPSQPQQVEKLINHNFQKKTTKFVEVGLIAVKDITDNSLEISKIKTHYQSLQKILSKLSKSTKIKKNNRKNWNTQGLPKTLCERFCFTYEGEWIQLDIPHTIMKELDLSLGENIPYPVYVSPDMIKRTPICGGITIEKKEEIFIAKPFSRDQECQTELTGEKITNLINEKNKVRLLANKSQALRAEKEKLLAKIKELQQDDNLSQKTIINLQSELAELEEKLTEVEKLKREKGLNGDLTDERDNYQTKWDSSIEELELKEEMIRGYLQQLSLKNSRIDDLEREKEELNDDLQGKQNEMNRLKTELDIEKGWWDKWINDNDRNDFVGWIINNLLDPAKFEAVNKKRLEAEATENYDYNHADYKSEKKTLLCKIAIVKELEKNRNNNLTTMTLEQNKNYILANLDKYVIDSRGFFYHIERDFYGECGYIGPSAVNDYQEVKDKLIASILKDK